ncbi:MAG: hypothetical protein OEO77_09730 [Acidimicrobiia bacterium]|nr:hypothetical protein [Acidimicrobiia bacterium]
MRDLTSISGMAPVDRAAPERTEVRRLPMAVVVIAFGLFLSLVNAAPAQADHVGATLDCDGDRTFVVDGRSDLPAGFDAPGPWSGLFLLEGTTQVFKAFKIENWLPQTWAIPAWQRHDLITCTLFVRGNMWTLYGVLRPQRP